MRISRTSMYAISAMIQLAELPPGIPFPCSQMAKTGEMPERFLLQILRILVNHGLLESTRGTEGGYSLARPASQISLLQILEAVDGPLISELPLLECIHPEARIHLQKKLRQIAIDTCRHLADVLLVDLEIPRTYEEGLAAIPMQTIAYKKNNGIVLSRLTDPESATKKAF